MGIKQLKIQKVFKRVTSTIRRGKKDGDGVGVIEGVGFVGDFKAKAKKGGGRHKGGLGMQEEDRHPDRLNTIQGLPAFSFEKGQGQLEKDVDNGLKLIANLEDFQVDAQANITLPKVIQDCQPPTPFPFDYQTVRPPKTSASPVPSSVLNGTDSDIGVNQDRNVLNTYLQPLIVLSFVKRVYKLSRSLHARDRIEFNRVTMRWLDAIRVDIYKRNKVVREYVEDGVVETEVEVKKDDRKDKKERNRMGWMKRKSAKVNVNADGDVDVDRKERKVEFLNTQMADLLNQIANYEALVKEDMDTIMKQEGFSVTNIDSQLDGYESIRQVQEHVLAAIRKLSESVKNRNKDGDVDVGSKEKEKEEFITSNKGIEPDAQEVYKANAILEMKIESGELGMKVAEWKLPDKVELGLVVDEVKESKPHPDPTSTSTTSANTNTSTSSSTNTDTSTTSSSTHTNTSTTPTPDGDSSYHWFKRLVPNPHVLITSRRFKREEGKRVVVVLDEEEEEEEESTTGQEDGQSTEAEAEMQMQMQVEMEVETGMQEAEVEAKEISEVELLVESTGVVQVEVEAEVELESDLKSVDVIVEAEAEETTLLELELELDLIQPEPTPIPIPIPTPVIDSDLSNITTFPQGTNANTDDMAGGGVLAGDSSPTLALALALEQPALALALEQPTQSGAQSSTTRNHHTRVRVPRSSNHGSRFSFSASPGSFDGFFNAGPTTSATATTSPNLDLNPTPTPTPKFDGPTKGKNFDSIRIKVETFLHDNNEYGHECEKEGKNGMSNHEFILTPIQVNHHVPSITSSTPISSTTSTFSTPTSSSTASTPSECESPLTSSSTPTPTSTSTSTPKSTLEAPKRLNLIPDTELEPYLQKVRAMLKPTHNRLGGADTPGRQAGGRFGTMRLQGPQGPASWPLPPLVLGSSSPLVVLGSPSPLLDSSSKSPSSVVNYEKEEDDSPAQKEEEVVVVAETTGGEVGTEMVESDSEVFYKDEHKSLMEDTRRRAIERSFSKFTGRDVKVSFEVVGFGSESESGSKKTTTTTTTTARAISMTTLTTPVTIVEDVQVEETTSKEKTKTKTATLMQSMIPVLSKIYSERGHSSPLHSAFGETTGIVGTSESESESTSASASSSASIGLSTPTLTSSISSSTVTSTLTITPTSTLGITPTSTLGITPTSTLTSTSDLGLTPSTPSPNPTLLPALALAQVGDMGTGTGTGTRPTPSKTRLRLPSPRPASLLQVALIRAAASPSPSPSPPSTTSTPTPTPTLKTTTNLTPTTQTTTTSTRTASTPKKPIAIISNNNIVVLPNQKRDSSPLPLQQQQRQVMMINRVPLVTTTPNSGRAGQSSHSQCNAGSGSGGGYGGSGQSPSKLKSNSKSVKSLAGRYERYGKKKENLKPTPRTMVLTLTPTSTSTPRARVVANGGTEAGTGTGRRLGRTIARSPLSLSGEEGLTSLRPFRF